MYPTIESWNGNEQSSCRLLIGMQTLPIDELRNIFSLDQQDDGIDQQTALRLKKRMAEEFRQQLMIGAPSNHDERTLQMVSKQIREGKLIVRLFLRHRLHGKLYLIHREDPNNPTIGFVGSSNLTLAGLSKQGELNVDVLDHDACQKLNRWFEDRWNDRWCLDISTDLADIIDNSWARSDALSPYLIYLKMAYHLSREARAGLAEFQIPREFGNKLFDFQRAAVKIAAHHINKRGGVLIGDVVGLGKTLMAAAVAKILEEDQYTETLIICPKNLETMWLDYVEQYRLHAKVLPITRFTNESANLRRYRVVLIDESHNLRNREGKRYRAIQQYIMANESRCILLSATPYNKSYLDLSAQLRLFIPEDRDLGIRPEELIREIGETEFLRRHQCPVRTLAAFEKSEHPDDWRELMRLFMVRRTRSFIKENYAVIDEKGRKHLLLDNGERSNFPERIPKTQKFKSTTNDKSDTYSILHSDSVVRIVNALNLPRYGLGNYIAASPHQPPTTVEAQHLSALGRAGKRLMGFCRTNLFKRLESSGPAFLQSVERHILRNFVYIHAIQNNLPLPIGTQEPELLDDRINDEDADVSLIDLINQTDADDEDGEFKSNEETKQFDAFIAPLLIDESAYAKRAAAIYEQYWTKFHRRFKWLRSSLFVDDLCKDLLHDARALLRVLKRCKVWNANEDKKLSALVDLVATQHPDKKILVFSQFADTVHYLSGQLKSRGIRHAAGVTGDSANPTELAWRFSPHSNNKRERIIKSDELRILITTDVLSEGQNLQDCSVIVNYDLPWAIIRLIQRAGRVDRIGQQSDKILCYSFLPAEGVERIIRLRRRVRERLKQNAEVVGSDESFFDDDPAAPILDIYNEKAGIFDGEADTEVDLASYAYQIWKNAIDENPKLEKQVEELPNVVYSTKPHWPSDSSPEGVLVYMRTPENNDALAWIDKSGNSVTQSQLAILKTAECGPKASPVQRNPKHHELVRKGIEHLIKEDRNIGGQLGKPSGARFKTYERLQRYRNFLAENRPLFLTDKLERAIDDIYKYPLWPDATDRLNRQLRTGISDDQLADLVIAIRDEGRLCIVEEQQRKTEAQIICSLGLFRMES